MPASRRLVPTLAALTLAGAGLGAMDGIAPVITLLDSDIQPTVPRVYQDETDPAAAFAAAILADDLYLYDSSRSLGYAWQQFDESPRMTGHAGLAVVAAETGSAIGTWQYRIASGSWTAIPGAVAEDACLLLPTVRYDAGSIVYTDLELRFLPDAGSPDGTARLMFRAWDGSSGSPETTDDTTWLADGETVVAGGSPTAFSAEMRSVRVEVRSEANTPPSIIDPDGIGGSTIDLHPGSTRFIILDASDPDGDAILWSWSSMYGSSISASFGSDGENNGVFVTAGSSFDLITFTASDGHGGSDQIQVSINPVNDAPTILDPEGHEAGSAETPIEVYANGSIDLSTLGISAVDPDDDELTWDDSYTLYGYVSGTTYSAYDMTGPDVATFTVNDPYGGNASITLHFLIVESPNQAPVIDSVDGLDDSDGYRLHVTQGGSATFSIALRDDDGDEITYDGFVYGEGYYEPSYGFVGEPARSVVDGVTTYTFAYDHDGSPAEYGDSFELQFSDGNGGTTTVWIDVSVAANSSPYIDTTVPLIAVRNQPYTTLITIRDDEADDPIDLSISGISGSHLTPVGATVTVTDGYDSHTQRTYRLSFVPTDAGSVSFDLTGSDGTAASYASFIVTVADPPAAAVDLAAIPLSTPGNPIYAAIAPGSTAGWSSLMTALLPHGADVARAWWWSTSGRTFRDAEESAVPASRQPGTALFLASTIGLSYSFDAKPYPMPFAIELPPAQVQATGPGTDGWTFFGVPALWDGAATSTSHTLNDFVLETADGRRVTSAGEIMNALAPDDALTVQSPWSYDPAAPLADRYQPAGTLATGIGYWIRNRSTTAYRLVRVTSTDESGLRLGDVDLGQFAEALARPAAAVSIVGAPTAADDKPPAPPSGTANATAKADSGSGCGAGGLAGLLLAGLTLVGLRGRRRS